MNDTDLHGHVFDELCRWKGHANYPTLGSFYRIRYHGSYLECMDINDPRDFAETNCWKFEALITKENGDLHFKFRGSSDVWDSNISKYIPNYVYLKTWELHLLQDVTHDTNVSVRDVANNSEGLQWNVVYSD